MTNQRAGTAIAVADEPTGADGQAALINAPLGEYREPTHRAKRQHWKKLWKLPFGIYLTLSNCRTKLRHGSHDAKPNKVRMLWQVKQRMYKEQQGRCPHCGKQFEIGWMELHHVLAWSRFPELRHDQRNLLFLCHDCHKDIHIDPYLNIRLMEAKAEELGIDLKEYYSYRSTGAVESGQECALMMSNKSTAPDFPDRKRLRSGMIAAAVNVQEQLKTQGEA